MAADDRDMEALERKLDKLNAEVWQLKGLVKIAQEPGRADFRPYVQGRVRAVYAELKAFAKEAGITLPKPE